MRGRSVLLALLVMALVLPALAQDDSLIVPGSRVGWMKVGMDFSVVQKVFGDSPCEKSQSNGMTVYSYTKQKFAFYVDSRNKVTVVATSHPKYRMENGITVGATRADVKKACGSPTQDGLIMMYDSGLAFEMSGDTVARIGVVQTGASESPSNVSSKERAGLALVFFYADG